MGKVYLSKDIDRILEKLDYSKLGKKVAIKLHFGEKRCKTYINPELVKKVYDRLVSLGKEAKLVECNVLYRGSRTNSTEHIKIAEKHGFTFAPIDILDGERGEEFIEVELEKGEVEKVKLGKGLQNYDFMIVISHLTGHVMAGFGGALKNIGMGLGSRAGKLQMHSSISPSIGSKCTGCGTCVENCNANAISLVKGKAEIDNEKCEGCAMCIAVCPQGAVKVPWHGATEEQLQKKIVDYAEGVIKLFKDKMIFINVLENITEDCDCMSFNQKKIADDIGIVFGEDIVSVDKASVDLAEIDSGKTQLDYAEEKGLGSKEYELVRLDSAD